MNETNILIFSLIGGILPAFFWLWFWVKEDSLKPEPRSALFSAFIGGVLAVFLALFFELIVYYLLIDASKYNINELPNIISVSLQNLANKYDLINVQKEFWTKIQMFFINSNWQLIGNINIKKGFLVIFIAPIIEELLKLILTYNICLRRKINDEPVDASIYMLTTALGFAAIETTIFLVEPVSHGNFMDTLIASNFRSIGPMLIHLLSSATLGLFIGLAFYKSKAKKILYLFLGLITAITVHSIFNFFIILNDSTHNSNFFWLACFMTWIFLIILLVFFEKVKRISLPKNKLIRKF